MIFAGEQLTIAPRRHLLTFPDATERAEFCTYDAEEQANVRELHDAMMEIATAKNPNQGCKRIASLHRGRKGWSASHLRTIYDEWEEAGRDWRWLVDEARFPAARGKLLSPVTQEWVHDMLLQNQRKFAPMIKAIQAQWRAWWRTGNDKYAIPGFVDEHGNPQCPPPDAGYLPRALQDHNLRRVKIEKAVVAMVRYGSHEARKVLPYIPGTREGVRWLEYVSGDDVELDVAAYVRGYGKCRMLQFGFYEMSCSVYIEDAFIQRPRLMGDEGSWKKLKQQDFLFSVANLIEKHGWPLDWKMHLLCENGTATMSRAKAQWLYEFSEGQIIVGYSSMDGEFVAAWEERKAGNSRAKAGHEGFHGILKNEMGHLRGQQGMDRDHHPALDYGREKVMNHLDNAIVQLPDEAADQIITPYLTTPQIWRETFDALQRIHHNPSHDCEGFETVFEWRPRGMMTEPRPMSEMRAFLAANPRLKESDLEVFDRVETRAERRDRLSRQGRFMAPPAAALVPFYEDNCELQRIAADGSFNFIKEGRKFRFLAPDPADRLPTGDKVVGFYRPDGEVLHIFTGRDTNRRYLTTYHSEGKLRRDADPATRAEFFSRKQRYFDHTYAKTNKATDKQIQKARDEAEHNELILVENQILAPNVQRGTNAAIEAVLESAVTETKAKRTRAARQTSEQKLSDLANAALSSAGDRFEPNHENPPAN